MDLSQQYVLDFEKPVPTGKIIEILNKDKNIKYSEGPMIAYLVSTEPDDPWFYLNHPGEGPYRWSFEAIDAPLAWDITKGSSAIKVGIHDRFDSTVAIHSELSSKVVWESPWNKLGYHGDHGSSVAGVVGAITDNNTDIASLGWNTSLMLAEWGYPYNNIDSLVELGADIINFSWVTNFNSPTLRNKIQNALIQGVILVAGAGNVELPIPGVRYPAAYNFGGSTGQVIAVSATEIDAVTSNEEFLDVFNYSPGTDPISDPTNAFIDFAAPGANFRALSWINTTGTRHIWSGTSFASPTVAATIALMLSINSTLTPNEVYDILKNSAEKIDASRHPYDTNGWNRYLGYGRINTYQAIKFTLENYGGTLSNDLTIVSGETWSFAEGITVIFQNNSSLKVNGTLNVNGTSSNKVTFDFVSPSSYNGIKFYYGSSGTVDYAVIKNAFYGVYIINTTPTIENCEIFDCSYGIQSYYNSPTIETNEIYDITNYGIYAYSGSPTITDNYIHNTDNYGITICSSTNTYICDNTIKDCKGGVYAYGNQTIKLYDDGLNKIEGYTSSGHAVYVTGGTAHLGEYHDRGNNSFIRNTSNTVIYNSSTNEVLAEKNYWGGSPQSSWFYGDVEWSFPLSSPSGGVGSSLGKSTEPDITPDRILFSEAMELADSNDHRAASVKFKELVNDYPDSRFAGLSVAWAMSSHKYEKNFTEQSSYLASLKEHKNKKVRDNSLLWLASLESEVGNKSAVEKIVNSTSINEKVGVEIRLNWANDLLNMYNDEKGAEAIFNELTKADATESTLFTIAAIKSTALNIEGREEVPKSEESNNNVEEIVISETKLNASYPNPFNPTTTISYQLQYKSHVSLIVYNSIGQVVVELVNQQKEKGIYNVDYNASNLPSGVYIYRLQIHTQNGKGNFTQAKKMMLLK